jgi:hypothetical protein
VGAAFSRDLTISTTFTVFTIYRLLLTVYRLLEVLSPFPSQNIYNSTKKGGKYYEGCNEPYWDSNQDAQFQNEY